MLARSSVTHHRQFYRFGMPGIHTLTFTQQCNLKTGRCATREQTILHRD